MVVRGFARYLSGIDPRTEVPPAGTIRHPHRWRRPFIYTDADVLAMIEQARVVIPQPLRSATYQTLIGLLATTGLRIGEALRLDRGDLDRADGCAADPGVEVRQVTARAAARQRGRRARALRPHPPTTAARPEHRQPVRVAARDPRDLRVRLADAPPSSASAPGSAPSSTVTPRIHDHRHAFAVKTLLGWYQDGVDVPSRISLALDVSRASRTPLHLPLPVRRAGPARARRPTAQRRPGGAAMTPVAPTLQAFFTDRLTRQLQASPRTIASYRDTLRLLLCFTQEHHRQAARQARLGRPQRDR